MPNTLFLRLEGPMQSWGERARWGVRDTAPEPTKSGIVGLLACALGLSEDDDLRGLTGHIDIGVRCDRPGRRLVDYHTVSGGVMSAERKVKRNATTHEPETVVSWRSYLHDASFLVVVQAGEGLIERLAEAVQAPHWPIFLGRESCPPTLPVFAGTGDFASVEAALGAIPLRQMRRALTPMEPSIPSQRVRAVITCLSDGGVRRRDEIDSRSHRTYLPRYTRDIYLSVPVEYI